MKQLNPTNLTTVLFMLTLLVVISTALVQAQTGDSYDLSWSTVDNGGGTSSGGSYVLVGTIGQPDAGVTVSGGNYSLVGGFWPALPGRSSNIYLPIILRQ